MQGIPSAAHIGCALALIAALSVSVAADAADKPAPNVLLILADDLGYHQVGCYSDETFYETPSIDRLARGGMRFTDAYAAAPVCSPTRASILTGKYPARLHLTDYIPGEDQTGRALRVPDWTKRLPLEETTLAEVLKRGGYATGHFGKWHLNVDKNYAPDRPGDPASQGFDDVLTTVKPRGSDDPTKDAHHVEEITDRAIAFMETNRSKPFFCYVTHNSIHDPLLEHPDLVAKYAAKPEANDADHRPVVGAMVERLDRSVGRLLDALYRLGLAENTVVVFFSDNGALHGRDKRKPLRRGKGDLYEGGIRVPLVVRWPGVVDADTACDEPVISVDFMPTILEVAGLESNLPASDGESLVPLLKQSGQLGRRAIYWHYPHYHSAGLGPSGAVRAGRYKLVEWFERSVNGPNTPGALELYDLDADWGENEDVSADNPTTTRELHGLLKAWRDRVGAQMMPRAE